MEESTCAKCGSTELIKDVRIVDHGHGNVALDLGATVYREPESWFFKNPVLHRFNARVCGACGYTEFYVENPGRLLEIAERVASKK